NHPSNQFTKKMRNRLINFLKEFTVKPAGFRGYNEAIITRGGISTKEIDSSTMQSKLINHLSIVGEMLDVDALTGGYNLQIAFSTGFVAGNNC
ncbi:MAG: NAD(P)/FAD-dependent oxidoreductase, partial [Candidatus Cloacimonadota bacterium]|nr:NAD(P)/FAD-dependent oxidoreductase [Candidatus Cloacimonadota bacterium]